MKKKIFVLALLLISIFCNSQSNTDIPILEFICELKVTTAKAFSVGKTAHGERVVIPITGGTFEGPLLRGVVLNGGADYQLVDKKEQRTELEAIYNIQTNDGITIHIRNIGLLCKSNESVYFFTSPKFEAPSDSKYNWLNNAIFICKPEGKDGYILLRVWKVK